MIKPILFISDLHLHPHRPKLLELFLHFLNKKASQAQALYILGDFFEIWIGDDDNSSLSQRIQAALSMLTNSGVAVYLMHGNRDFLIGKRFCERTRCQLLNDPSQVNLFGRSVLLTHGDLLCTDDIQYQRFRQFVRSPWFKNFYLKLPLFLRRCLAHQARKGSKKHIDNTASQIMDVNQNAVLQMMQTYQVDLLIHGHTHHPAIHKFLIDNQTATRIVLGAWHCEKNAKILLCSGPQDYKLIPMSLTLRETI